MILREKNIRRKLMAAMTDAYQEHQDEVAENPRIEKQTWEDFFSAYGPTPDAGALIDYFNRKACKITQDAFETESGDSGQGKLGT